MPITFVRALAAVGALVSLPWAAHSHAAEANDLLLSEGRTPILVEVERKGVRQTARIGLDAAGGVEIVGDLSRSDAEAALRSQFCPLEGQAPYLVKALQFARRKMLASPPELRGPSHLHVTYMQVCIVIYDDSRLADLPSFNGLCETGGEAHARYKVWPFDLARSAI